LIKEPDMSDQFVELIIKQVKISIAQGDITLQDVDAIVNAANPGLMGGGGVDGAIHRAAGPSVLEECKRIIAAQGRLPTGKAVVTGGGNLKARFIIHTVGPVWRGGRSGEQELLASAYRESLKLADEKGLKTVSFPSISTGAYGYPVEEAAGVALSAITAAAQGLKSVRQITLVLFDSRAYSAYRNAMNEFGKEKQS
jgi:O-acetyl-ADP-ribose deacetylase